MQIELYQNKQTKNTIIANTTGVPHTRVCCGILVEDVLHLFMLWNICLMIDAKMCCILLCCICLTL